MICRLKLVTLKVQDEYREFGCEKKMAQQFQFGEWKILPDQCSLVRGEHHFKVEPKAMDVLVTLIDADGNVVSRNDIFERVWPNQIIADYVLNNLIAKLRKILEQDPQQPKYILTVVKKGYRLGQPVTSIPESNIKKKPNIWAVTAGLCGIVLLAFAAWRLLPASPDNAVNNHSQSEAIDSETVESPTSTNRRFAIAILPFKVFDEDTNTGYFVDGLVEEIIHQLATIPELPVISRTSSFAFRDSQDSLQTIADKLNAKYILEGSFRRSGDNFRVTVQLINTVSDTYEWSSVFEIVESETFTLQENISEAVIKSLLPDYDPSFNYFSHREHPNNHEAYLHFLRGNAMAGKGTVESINLALKEFNDAIELADDYALAYTDIALNTMVLYQFRELDAETARQNAEAAITRALALQPYLASAHAAAGLVHINFGEYQLAQDKFKRALELDPTSHLAHHNYGYLLWIQNEHEQALRHFKIALAHNPMSRITNFGTGDSMFWLGRLPDAKKQFQHCLSLFPDYPACHLGLANFYRVTNQKAFAEEHMQKAANLLAHDNFYYLAANMLHALWYGNFAEMARFNELIQSKSPNKAEELQINTLLNASENNLEAWIEHLETLQATGLSTQDFYYALGFAYYLDGNCKDAIQNYQLAEIELEPASQFFPTAYGVSHQLNIADCYNRTQQTDKFNQSLKLINHQLDSYQSQEFEVAGEDIIRAKLAFLTDKRPEGLKLLADLKKSGAELVWLLNIDPVLQQYTN